jgi:hypothetical protein
MPQGPSHEMSFFRNFLFYLLRPNEFHLPLVLLQFAPSCQSACMYEFCRVCFPYSTGNFLGADTGLCVSLVSITPNRIQVREEKGGSKHKKCQTLILFDLDPLVLPSVVGRGEGGKERERERERDYSPSKTCRSVCDPSQTRSAQWLPQPLS